LAMALLGEAMALETRAENNTTTETGGMNE
jgi:hypothetical protein